MPQKMVVLIFAIIPAILPAQNPGLLPADKVLVQELKPVLERLTTEAKTHFKSIQTKDYYVSDAKIPFPHFTNSRVIDGEKDGFHEFDASLMDFPTEDSLRATLLRLKNAIVQTSLGQPALMNGKDGFVWEKKINGNPLTVTIWRYAKNIYFEMHEYHSDQYYAAHKAKKYPNTTAFGFASVKTEMAPQKAGIVKGAASPQMVADCKTFVNKMSAAAASHLSSLKGTAETSYRWLSTVTLLDFERNLIIEDGGRHYFAAIKKYTNKKLKEEDFGKIADAFNQYGFGKLEKEVANNTYIWAKDGPNGTCAIIMKNMINEIWIDFAESHSIINYDPNAPSPNYTTKTNNNNSGSSNTDKEKLANELQYQKNMAANLEKLTQSLKEIDKRFDECRKISNNISDASKKKNTGFYIENESRKLGGKLIDIKYDLKQLLREYQYKVPQSALNSIESLIEHAENWLEILDGEE